MSWSSRQGVRVTRHDVVGGLGERGEGGGWEGVRAKAKGAEEGELPLRKVVEEENGQRGQGMVLLN